jgi:DNA sulfur modification protein DndC
MLNVEDVIKLVDEIQNLYLKDTKPWIIGYSGGKDSTATLQLIYRAISKLSMSKRHKKIWVVSSDTLVEIPTVVDRLDKTLNNINEQSKLDNMPFEAIKVAPEVDSSFFVNLIGRGYPSPTRIFRWCTDRLKIKPTSKFIEQKVNEYGEVIIILGARKKESMSRAQTMENYAIKGSILKKHSTLRSAFIYTPIENWDLEDVWTYLLQVPSPWGENNMELITLYRKAGGDECPLVVDTSTPSCGNSRFGCWVCTVVEQDKSIHGFIESGEAWLEPMAIFRDYIKEIRENRSEYRIKDESRIGGFGPFTIRARKEILKKLIETQKSMLESHNNKLISGEELWAIQNIWQYEGEPADSVSKIYRSVNNEDLEQSNYDTDLSKIDFDSELLLSELCEESHVSVSVIQKLLFIEKDLTKMRRKIGLYERLDTEFTRAVSEESN